MPTALKLALSAAAVVAVAVVGFGLIYGGSSPGIGGAPSTPSSAPTASPSPTPAPSPSPSPTQALTDPSTWPTSTSDVYGFVIGHPSDWTAVPATRAWTFGADATNPVLSEGADAFVAPEQDVRVNAWSVASDLSVSEGWEELQAWVEDYCPRTDLKGCAGIADRLVPMCVEFRDCHAGALLVPFETEIQAFVISPPTDPSYSGDFRDRAVITIVSVWRADDDPSVARYGGAQRLLEAFLQTMNVWPTEENR